MSIRIRLVNGVLIAVCAARSMPKTGDIYLDDGAHKALSEKFAEDFNSMFDCGIPTDNSSLRELEESDNQNRETWDTRYGKR